MKRFLSIMLTVMLVLSSFVMVSASEDAFKVITVDGTTVDGTFEYSLGATYEGYYEISADVYVTADVTEASIGAANAVTAIDEEKAGEWQTVKVNVLDGSFNKVNFVAEGGKMYVKAINVAKLYKQTLVYTEDFEEKVVGESVLSDDGYKHNTTNAAALGDNVSTFTVANAIGGSDNVGYIYRPTYYQGGTFGDDNRVNITTTDVNENFYIDIAKVGDADHIKLEFDAYNAAQRRYDGINVDKLGFAVGGKASGNVFGSNYPYALIEKGETTLPGNNKPNGPAVKANNAGTETWEKVVYEAKRYINTEGKWCFDYSVTYGGEKVTQTKVGVNENNANSFNRLFFGMDCQYGGGFYIDNIKVYTLSDDFSTECYTEDFEKFGDKTTLTEGQGWTGSYNGATTNLATFKTNPSATMDSSVSPNVKSSAGVLEKLANKYSGTFYYDIDAVGDADHIKLEFDTRLTGISILSFAMGRNTVANGQNTNNAYATIALGSTTLPGNDAEATDVTVSNSASNNKATHKIVYEARRYTNADGKLCVTYSVTFGGATATQTKVGANVDNFKRLYFTTGNAYADACSVYVDNIKVSSFVNTDAQLAALDTYASVAYSVNAEAGDVTDAYEVFDGTFSNTAQTITLVKTPGAAESIQVVTAIYKGGVLQNAAITPVDTADKAPFAEFAVTLIPVDMPETIDGETFKVFVFDTEAGLRPLADMFRGSVATPAE